MRRREAAGWLARLQSGRDPACEDKFRRWHDGDPANAAAFESVRRSYEQAGLLRHSPIVSERPAEVARPAPASSARYAWAAVAALIVIVPAGLLMTGREPASLNAIMLETRIGEIRSVELVDGTRVTLDTASRVEVEVGRKKRRAVLQRGRARFVIANGAPFVVEAGSTIVTTQGSVVDVEMAGARSRVGVLSGSAEVRSSKSGEATPLVLRDGEGASDEAAGLTRTSVAHRVDWTRGMLRFEAAPLGEAVATANLYSSRKIILGSNVEELRVTGAYRAGDNEGLAMALARAFGLNLVRSAGGSLTLSRSLPPAPRKKKGG